MCSLTPAHHCDCCQFHHHHPSHHPSHQLYQQSLDYSVVQMAGDENCLTEAAVGMNNQQSDKE